MAYSAPKDDVCAHEKMSHAMTAQDLFSEMKRMPSTERTKFFRS